MKKVLLILYYWPPAGGPGVQRWLKFVTYFKRFNIDIVLYLPSNPHYPLKDESLLKEVPEGLTIYTHPIKEPYRWASVFSSQKTTDLSAGVLSSSKRSFLSKLMLFIRGNFFIPDARVSWVKPSVTYLNSILDKEGIDTVITSGPPHSLHLIGMRLKEKRPIKWLADFRDPWTKIHYHDQLLLSSCARKKHQLLEAKVLQSADLITVTSPSTMRDFKTLTTTPIALITNGFDIDLNENAPLDTYFSLTHVGSLLSERNPVILWSALAELCEEVPGFKEDLRLIFVGKTDQYIIDHMEHVGLSSNCEVVGYLPHHKAVEYQRKSQVLLLVESFKPEVAQIIPGKLFEYLAAKRPIIAIGPESWDIDELLADTAAGSTYVFDDKNSLKNDILTYYQLFKKGKITIESDGIEAYHRSALTQKMAQLIWEL